MAPLEADIVLKGREERLLEEGKYRSILMQDDRHVLPCHDVRLGLLAFLDRRARAHRVALQSFKTTLAASPDFHDMDEVKFGVRLQVERINVICELAGLVALWTRDATVRNVAGTAASALRTSLWLWLEDDDRAMATLRVVLEMTARLQVTRGKPGLKWPRLEAQ